MLKNLAISSFLKLKHMVECIECHANKRLRQEERKKGITVGNKISIEDNLHIVHLDITGTNNNICVKKINSKCSGKVYIKIYGDNNTITIDEDFFISEEAHIIIGNTHHNYTKVFNASINIGKNVSLASGEIITLNSGSKISIGDNCLLARNIQLWNTDAHPIFKLGTAKIANYVKELKIGEHCWIGENAKILKNVEIAKDCIVGMSAVVAKSFLTPNSIIAGNPAKVIKQGYTWTDYSYEYCNNDCVPIPKIATVEETIQKLISDKSSICRFGDGEFHLLLRNKNINFQKWSPEISQRLNEILVSQDENILIATNHHYYSSLLGLDGPGREWNKEYLYCEREKITKLLTPGKQYYSAEFTLVSISTDKNYLAEHFEKLQKIWHQRNIAIIQGQGIAEKHKHNIFANAKSIEYIEAPSKDAFALYAEILSRAQKISKETLIIIILGPTATILAYDLARLGYQALDLGHLAKSYNFYLENKTFKTINDVTSFFAPD